MYTNVLEKPTTSIFRAEIPKPATSIFRGEIPLDHWYSSTKLQCHFKKNKIWELPAIGTSIRQNRNIALHKPLCMDQDSVQLDDLVIESWLAGGGEGGGDFLQASRPALGPPSLLYKGSFPWVMQLQHGVHHPPLLGAEVKEGAELYLYSPSVTSWKVIR
jgi:hypothetical protein